jgi:signal transduction histidine kinase
VDTLTADGADAGLVRLEQLPVRLDALVQESFDEAVMLAEPTAVQVTLTGCAAVTVLGDRDRLRQLLLNLVDNAVKYNRPGGHVTMALRRPGDRAELSIANTGDGIPPRLQNRVFDRFVRGDGPRSRAVEGCGLGLSICRWIVQEHGGSIQIASQPGETTTVTVLLPVAPSQGHP